MQAPNPWKALTQALEGLDPWIRRALLFAIATAALATVAAFWASALGAGAITLWIGIIATVLIIAIVAWIFHDLEPSFRGRFKKALAVLLGLAFAIVVVTAVGVGVIRLVSDSGPPPVNAEVRAGSPEQAAPGGARWDEAILDSSNWE